MSEPFVGEIKMFAGNFAPRNYAFCDGQLLAISQNNALFSLLGTIYGGDGETTFGLPDLRGRVPLHTGQGTGLSSRPLGQRTGAEKVTLTTNQLPSHTHRAASTDAATLGDPGGNVTGDTGSTSLYRAGTESTMHASAMCDFKFEAPFVSSHGNVPPVCGNRASCGAESVELLCDTIAVALRERCAGALRHVAIQSSRCCLSPMSDRELQSRT